MEQHVFILYGMGIHSSIVVKKNQAYDVLMDVQINKQYSEFVKKGRN